MATLGCGRGDGGDDSGNARHGGGDGSHVVMVRGATL